VQLEAEDVIVTAANLSILHQRVLDLPGHRHSLSQERGVVPEICLWIGEIEKYVELRENQLKCHSLHNITVIGNTYYRFKTALWTTQRVMRGTVCRTHPM
jgi:hypothetical protein